MPFDREDTLPGIDGPRFKATPANASRPDEVGDVARCSCPACSGAISDTDGAPIEAQGFLNVDQRGAGGLYNGHPSKTVAEAALQLNRTYGSWNNFYIQPGVADVDNRWDDPYWGGEPSVVRFGFRATAPGNMPDDTAGFSRFNTAQINATLLALQSWADVANIIFLPAGTGTSGDAAYSNDATILFANYSSGVAGAGAFAYPPSLSAAGGDVWVNATSGSNLNPQLGNYGMLTLVHEIGHAIGFSHPGEYNAGEGGPITYANAVYYEDSHQYTVMSYFQESYTGGDFGPSYPAAPQLDDIAAAQRTYGVNTTTRTGDTVYGFNSTADRPWFSATAGSTVVFAVWDAGGVDTLDFSGYSQAQVIELRAGYFSNVGGRTGNVVIAIGAVVENAIGGSGADTLIGNTAANRLQGNAGADTLTGGAGADIFVITVGGGADTITDFTAGSDRIDIAAFGAYQSIAQSGANTLVTVIAGVTVTLLNVVASTITAVNFITGIEPPPAGYNLINGTGSGETLNGAGASDQIYGLAGDDILNGGASADWLEGGADNDTLDGGAGADTLIGGAGDDVYIVDAAGDVVTENAGAGQDTVRTNLASYSLAANVEVLTGTAATGQTLVGNGLGNVITGGAGGDTLTGGGGADVFVVVVGGGADTITDFVVGTDKIDVTAFGAYQNLVQSGADTLITFAAGVTLRLTGVTASTVTSASFIGLTPPGPNVITGTAAANVLNGTAGVDHILGLGGNDTLQGLGGDDRLEGAAGIDKLYGGEGDDRLEGGDGADLLDGGIGADTLIGGIGDDTYVVDAAGDVVTEAAAAGTDTVQTGLATYVLGANLENLTGTAATGQTLTGNAAVNIITGGAGGDTLNGLGGDDRVYGGLGADDLDGGDGADKLYGDEGDDAITGGVGADFLYGGADNDTLTGGADLDRLFGEDGADILIGDDGADVLQGGAGADRLTGGLGNDILTGGTEADVFVVTVGGGVDSITDFEVGVDRIDLSTFGGYLTLAQNGADTLITFASGVSMRLKGVTASTVTNASFIGLPGGPAYNVITGTAAGETLNGTGAADQISGLGGADTLIGGVGDDLLIGGTDADIFVVTIGGGADTVSDFTVGSDRIDVTAFGSYLSLVQQGSDTLVTVAAGVSLLLQNTTAATISSASFIGLAAGPTYNVITGTAAGETLNGTGAADQISGLGGADTLIGGGGADLLIGGEGADVFVATVGGGADTISDFVVGLDRIDVSAFGVYLSIVQQGADTLVTVATGVSLLLQNTTASTVTDASFIGLTPPGPTFNEIVGTAASETLNGTTAADHIQGLDAVDRLFGLGGDDWLEGGAGNDVLVGGLGSDLLTGGAGSDTFRWDSTAEFAVGTLDRILDFGAGDRINLSAIDANVNSAGDQAFTVVSAFSNVAGQLRTTYDSGLNETLVALDVNGDGAADYSLVVNGSATLAWVL